METDFQYVTFGAPFPGAPFLQLEHVRRLAVGHVVFGKRRGFVGCAILWRQANGLTIVGNLRPNGRIFRPHYFTNARHAETYFQELNKTPNVEGC